MSLPGKRPTMLSAIVLAAALACAAVLLAGSAPAFAKNPCDPDPATPDCLAITSVSPAPGATNVPLGPPASALADFNQRINIDAGPGSKIRLKNVDTKANVPGLASYRFGTDVLSVDPLGDEGSPSFECGTTYKVIVGGTGRRSVIRSESGLKLREVPAGVSLKDGVARWTFTTVACT